MSEERTVTVRIIPDVSRFQAALNRASDATMHAWAAMAGQRYWTDYTGRVRRVAGKRPLLHKGGKP